MRDDLRAEPAGVERPMRTVRHSHRVSLIVLFLAAAALRVTWVGVRYGRDHAWAHLQYPDEEAYVLSAKSLAGGRGLIDEFGYRATYMPGYPAFLALFVEQKWGLLWARFIQALLAAGAAPATYVLAREFMKSTAVDGPKGTDPNESEADSRRIPFVAGALAAMDPFLVFFSGLLLTEALYAAVLVSAWVAVFRLGNPARSVLAVQIIVAGIFLLAVVMLRPAAMMLVVATACILPTIRQFHRSGWWAGAGLLVIVALGLIPWGARNRAILGEWQWLTTRGGITLYDGVQSGTGGGSDLAHTKRVPEARGLPEARWDDYWRRQAWSLIRSEPGRVLRLAKDKFLRTWSLTPNEVNYRKGPAAVVSKVWMTVLLLGAAVGWWVSRRRIAAWVLLLLPVLMTTVMHMIFVGSVRYRVPVMPMLMVLASVALVSGCVRWGRAGHRHAQVRPVGPGS